MSDEIKNSEKKSKSIMRNTKAVRYSKNLMFVAGAMGVTTGALLANTPKAEPNKKNKDENLKNTVDETQFMLKNMRNRNKMYIRGANLELIQLMEQGDQVVKSPWRSWQFGMNFFSNADIISGDGYGDKQEKYTYNSLYFRNNWKMKNALVSDDSIGVTGLPITPGNESQVSWRTANGNIYSGMNFDTSKGSSVNGEVRWGLVELRDIHEPLNEVEILARISPKEVKKESVSLNVAQPAVKPVGAPKIEPNITPPLEAPKITIPDVKVEIKPEEPGVTVNVTPPTITALNITTPGSVGTINVTAPSVNPVDFILGTAELSGIDKRNFVYKYGNRTYDNYLTLTDPSINVNAQNQYISTWGEVKNLDKVKTNVNVNVQDTRAFMIDEGIDYRDSVVKPFTYSGTINLNASKNVGIDVQGTHTGYSGSNKNPSFTTIDNVANVQVINKGNINGNNNAAGTNMNQVAFGFNNFDASSNNTRTEMINRGNITLNSKESAGIQLRPENPNANDNNNSKNEKLGLNMMTAYNDTTGKIDINSNGSFGMLTVQNKDASGNAVASKTYYNYGTTTLPGGQIASRAQKENMSYMKNTGTINVNGTSSIGIGHLHNIQAVYAGGTINVAGSSSVGVYTEVATRPVLVGKNDDHGLTNTSGKTVGTETVEVSGTITVSGTGSSGVYAKDKGSITLKDNRNNADADTDNKTKAEIEVTGTKSYGAVLDGVALNLEKNTEINVKGKESIGYVLKKGTGSNKGKIEVRIPPTITSTNPSLGFYGNQGTFTNEEEGEIYSSGKVAHAVALAGDATGITFNNKGKIETIGKGNIGVYADGKYTFNHSGNRAVINAGTDTVGIYAKKDGILNIKAPINIADSSGTGTTIGIYSDGEAQVNFGENSNLRIGKGAVGLYSEDAAEFNNTFKIEAGKTLGVELGKNSTFGLLNGNNTVTASPLLSNYLVSRTTNGNINITSFDEGASLFYATSKATAILDESYTIGNGGAPKTSVLVANNGSRVEIAKGIELTTNTNVGLIATKGTGTAASIAQNNGTIKSTRDSGIGIYTNESTGNSTGIITMEEGSSVGILGEKNSTLTNSGKIEVSGDNSAGIYGKDSDITNSGTGTDKGIYVEKGSSAGIFGVVSGTVPKTITNAGDIITKATESAGIYGEVTSAGSKLTIAHTGNITVNGNKSVGIFAENTAGTVANLVIDNTIRNAAGVVTKKGTININNEKSVGIYATNSTVSGVGKITLGKDANESIGVYAAAGSAITTTTAEIDLGKGRDQNRVAYYVKNENTALTGDNIGKIGKISGYGVGVYLEGTSATDVAKLITPPTTPSTPALDYTTGNDQGNGIIGLYLRGNTDISGYEKQITVGKTVEDNVTNTKYYAIGIYADRQGTAGNKYEIKAPITTGANGIGIFAANNSNIKYHTGIINVGKNGIGIYVQEKGSSGTSKVELGSTASGETFTGPKINLEEGSVAAIVGENAHFDGGNAIINLNGSGVGVYGLKGSVTNVRNWTFNNHGNSAEEVRSKEGKVEIDDNKKLKPGIVLSHVINGETYIVSGKKVESERYGSFDAGKNIGLMAEGNKNPAQTIWTQGDYEIVNKGEIDFKAGSNSTGIYAASARVKNAGKIKVGSQSTGIYGEYINDILKVETTAGSEIELGDRSVGVYLKNANSNINLDGKITSSAGATKNVGVYMINDAGTPLAGMVNKAEITLGDGSVGLYSKGKAPNAKNTVTNTGKITVGKKIAGTPSVPSVGIYAENTNLITVASPSGPSSDITVGEDGIAFMENIRILQQREELISAIIKVYLHTLKIQNLFPI